MCGDGGDGGDGESGPAPGEPGANAPSPGSDNSQAGQEGANQDSFGGSSPSDEAPGTGSISALEKSLGLGTLGETTGNPGLDGPASDDGPGPSAAEAAIGLANVEKSVDEATPSQGSSSNTEGGTLDGFLGSFFGLKSDPVEQGIGLGLNAVSTPLGFAFGFGQFGRAAAAEFGGSIGPSTGSNSSGNVDFGGSGSGAAEEGNTGGDGAAPFASIPDKLKDITIDDISAPAPNTSQPQPPAVAPIEMANSNIDEIQAELDADAEARRRRRRAGRQSTIVTGPLGVRGRPELLRPVTTPGASRRLLGQ